MEIILNLALSLSLIAVVVLALDLVTDFVEEVGGPFKKYYLIILSFSALFALFFWVLYFLCLIWF